MIYQGANIANFKGGHRQDAQWQLPAVKMGITLNASRFMFMEIALLRRPAEGGSVQHNVGHHETICVRTPR